MAGVAHDDHSHAVFLCLLDRKLHCAVAYDLSHTVMTVNDCRGGSLLYYLKVGDRVLDAVSYSVKIYRLEAVDAVRLDASLVRLEKNVRADLRVLSRYSVADEGVDHEACDRFPINDVCFCHFYIPPKNN